MVKKIFTTMVLGLVLVVSNSGGVMALNSGTKTAGERQQDEFKVSEILTLPGQDKAKFMDSDGANGQEPIVRVIMDFIDIAILVIGSFAFLMMVVAGFMMMLSGSGSNQDQAKNMFVYSLVGVAAAFSSYIIVTFVQSVVTGT